VNNVKETLSALLFADRAKQIKNKATINVVKENSTEDYIHQVKFLEEEVKRLNLEISKFQQQSQNMLFNFDEKDDQNKELHVLKGLLH